MENLTEKAKSKGKGLLARAIELRESRISSAKSKDTYGITRKDEEAPYQAEELMLSPEEIDKLLASDDNPFGLEDSVEEDEASVYLNLDSEEKSETKITEKEVGQLLTGESVELNVENQEPNEEYEQLESAVLNVIDNTKEASDYNKGPNLLEQMESIVSELKSDISETYKELEEKDVNRKLNPIEQMENVISELKSDISETYRELEEAPYQAEEQVSDEETTGFSHEEIDDILDYEVPEDDNSGLEDLGDDEEPNEEELGTMVETLTEDNPVYEQPEESVESTEEESGNGLLYNVGQGVASVYNRLTEVFRREPRETSELEDNLVYEEQPEESVESIEETPRNGLLYNVGQGVANIIKKHTKEGKMYAEFVRLVDFYSDEVDRLESLKNSLENPSVRVRNPREKQLELRQLLPYTEEKVDDHLTYYSEYSDDALYEKHEENLQRLGSMREELTTAI
ncbi:MAG: hypothetical protein QF362_01435, partial [Candidatus Woesearchaeota archaeon]|nr:hypothetical protein [Candidatus Woesearchaeota archaeon]